MNSLVWVQALTLGAALAVLGWALAAGPLRIFARASREFAGFNLWVLLAGASWWPWELLAPLPSTYRLALGLVLVLAGLQWLCNGLQTLHDLKPTYVTSPFMLPVLAVLMAGVAWLDSPGTGPWLAFFSASLWVASITVQQAFPSLIAQGGVRTARWSLSPLAGAGLVWLTGMAGTVWLAVGGHTGAPESLSSSHLVALPEWQMALLVASWGLLNGGLVALLLLKLVDKIRELSTEDDLTGALNMRSFMALLNDERDRLRRTPQPQALLVCEIDQYHALNKQLGFAAGDAALRHVTGVLGRGLRKTDRLGRSLNAELLMFLPATPSMGAMLVAERTQAAVKSNPFLWNGQSVNLTLSIGVSGREDGDMPSESLLEFCAHAVRRAQREGGGRIRVAQHDTLTPDITVADRVVDGPHPFGFEP
jgi:diguanylate cyclase (GGDEF)-like protein